MPRDVPLGNGQLLVCFDGDHQIRDFYYPFVGKENHVGGFACRLGLWVDGVFRWITRASGFALQTRYEADSLVSEVVVSHPDLPLTLTLRECVDFHEAMFLRKCSVKNHGAVPCDVRLFFHYDFRVSESDVGDTVLYDPRQAALVHYKGQRYFLMSALSEGRAGVQHFATGQKGSLHREGTFRDAEDGALSSNPIAQGAVDSVVAVRLYVPAQGQKEAYQWVVAGPRWSGSWDAVAEMNAKIVERGPDSFFDRTQGYWQAWSRKEPVDFCGLPESLVALYRRSLLLMRTQIDNRGGILAANDTDILHFNRDTYSYVWPRDGAFVAQALDAAGYGEISLRFFQFCADVLTTDGYLLQKYNPDQTVASSWHPWYADGKQQLPIQEDETALVLWALWKHFEKYRDIEAVKPLYGRLVRRAADFLVHYRDPHTHLPAASYDLWEERRCISSFTCAAVYGGLRAAEQFARTFGDEGPAARYAQAAQEMAEAMQQHLWSSKHNRFLRCLYPLTAGRYEPDATIDASIWGVGLFGILSADDPRLRSTMEQIHQALWCNTEVEGLARYEGDAYQRDPGLAASVPGNPWFLCTLWYADWCIAQARSREELAKAVSLLAWVERNALPSGVLAEQIHPITGAALSVAPLTWSHAAYVSTVHRYFDAWRALPA